jgi:exosortase D (VPLPA-CTERM-specific)
MRLPFTGSWLGVGFVVAGLAIWVLGELSALLNLVQYAFLITLTGAVLSITGWRVFRAVWMSLFILVLMIPLPNFIYFNLSQKLQLLSSEIGVWFIRLAGISVYLEGNVIDLGDYKLQVVEACSGLRYLFPLMVLGFIAALFFRARWWQRAVLFISTAPITVLMNSFRIGMIGLLVNEFGPAQAEGFLHDFEGWVIFMACFGLLLLEMALLLRLSGSRAGLRSAFAVDLPARLPAQLIREPRPIPLQAWVAAGLLALAVAPAILIPSRTEAIPSRRSFAEFPMRLGEWQGSTEPMDRSYIDELKFSDYILATYGQQGTTPVNLYVAYYESQRKGESIHSPKGCLPGGGWVIEDFGQHQVAGVQRSGQPLFVNRALISHGSDRQLVYYWFQQRGRILTNEYLVKWYLFWDSLTRNRTDGSLVRLITPIPTGDPAERADKVLEDFARTVAPNLSGYIPD